MYRGSLGREMEDIGAFLYASCLARRWCEGMVVDAMEHYCSVPGSVVLDGGISSASGANQ